MNSALDKPPTFDESCAQEVTSPIHRLQTATPIEGRLDRLDLWIWVLCFCFGMLVGRQALPFVESWFNFF